MWMLRCVLALAFLSASGMAFADEFFAVTPSGATEMLFSGKSSEAITQLSSKCIDARWTVVSSSNSELVCEAPLSMGQSIMGQMLLGNSYSTPPRRFYKFNVVEGGGVSRVQASGWMETQMAFGQMQRADFNGPPFHNSVMGFMGSAGGKFPVGTSFPNHVVMGFQAENIKQGKYGALKVKEVTPGTPAAKAPLLSGDVVYRIAGRKFKDDEEYLDALAKAAKTPSYVVDVTREGKSIPITLERDFRPAITESATPKIEAIAANAPSAASISVADELSKLEALRKQGILTDAEFDLQKKKVLAK